MRVLVIDDDPTIVDLVLTILTVEGIDVAFAESGEDGLLQALRDQPDVIILDVMMPKVDGWQIAAKLQKHPHTAHIPIVFCTALVDDDSVWRGWQSGAASYITKPFDPPHLVEELRRVTSG